MSLEKPLVDPLGDDEELQLKLTALDDDVDETEGATLKATTFNLINTVIGAGLLALPQQMQQNGIILGVLLVVIVAVMADCTVSMLLYATDVSKETNFGKISQVLAGPVVKFFVDVVIFLLNFGLCASYCIIIGDNLVFYAQAAGAPPGSLFQDVRVLLAGVVVLILYPLSTLKQMNALRHVSLLCLVFITLFVGLIVLGATGTLGMPVAIDIKNASTIGWTQPLTVAKMLQSVPVVFFAFVCHMNVPLLYNELRRVSKNDRPSKWKSKKGKMMCAVHVAIGYCTLLYCIVGVAGYILFGDNLDPVKNPDNAGNILNAIHVSDLSIAPYVKLVYAILLALSFPCMSYSGRAALHRLMLVCCKGLDNMGDKIRFLEAAIVVGTTAGLAMTGLSVDVAFGLTGSITCTAIMYIFPGTFHFIATKRTGGGCAAKVLGIVVIAFGFVVMAASTASILISAF